MNPSLHVVRGLVRMRRGLLGSMALTVVAAVVAALAVPGSPWLSALLGCGTAAVMFAVSLATTRRTMLSEYPSVGWIALDYLAKVALVGGSLITAKYVAIFNLQVVAGLVIFAVILNMLVQVFAFVFPGDARESGPRAQ